MQAVLDEREVNPTPTVGARKDEAAGTDAFVKALLARPPVTLRPQARDGRGGVAERFRGVPILARSLFRDLIRSGFEAAHVVALSTALIELTTSLVRVRAAERECPEAGAHLAIVPLDEGSES
jgi:hypothetical protein